MKIRTSQIMLIGCISSIIANAFAPNHSLDTVALLLFIGWLLMS